MKILKMKIIKCGYKGNCPFCRSTDSNPNNPFIDPHYEPYCHHKNGQMWIYIDKQNKFPEECPLKEV